MSRARAPRDKKALRAPLVADTGGLLRALACDDRGHPTWPAFARVLEEATAVLVPDLVLAEVDYFLRNEREGMRRLVADILDPASTYELVMTDPVDLVRALHIDVRFHSLQLGLVDSLVCAVAERRDATRVLTTDVRDFSVVRIGARYDRGLTLVP